MSGVLHDLSTKSVNGLLNIISFLNYSNSLGPVLWLSLEIHSFGTPYKILWCNKTSFWIIVWVWKSPLPLSVSRLVPDVQSIPLLLTLCLRVIGAYALLVMQKKWQLTGAHSKLREVKLTENRELTYSLSQSSGLFLWLWKMMVVVFKRSKTP